VTSSNRAAQADDMSSEPPPLLWLGDSRSAEPALVGGKAANLSRLAAEHAVPPGFCLTTAAFRRWSTMGSEDVPAELRELLADAYHALAERCGIAEPSVAVRSSAADEDGLTASFAGQHETYLNIVGIDAVVAAALRCWQSAYAERALEYRREQGLAEAAPLAVLVQQLVAADCSAVVFSANPISGNRDEIVINASWGLGESIVGGTVTPDTFVVSKGDLRISERQVAEKSLMTIRADGGTREVVVPRFLRAQPALDDAQILEVARLAQDLEDDFGWPVDVECAFQGEQLYLLQCRPITTLKTEKA
jgi:pyruvate, water dikinase